jgi:hypothetical protein
MLSFFVTIGRSEYFISLRISLVWLESDLKTQRLAGFSIDVPFRPVMNFVIVSGDRKHKEEKSIDQPIDFDF